MGQFKKAEEFYKAAYIITPSIIGKNWRCIHDESDKPDDASEQYNAALELQLEYVSDDDPSLSMTYTDIGSALHSQYQLDEALEYFQQALDIAPEKTKHDILRIAKIHSHIGGVFKDQKEYLPSVHPLLATTYNNIGLVYQSMDDYR